MILALLACARTGYDPVDLQLDVDGPLPDDAETLHVCVTGAGELEAGAGNGRLAFTGLPYDTTAEVRLEVYDADGRLLAAAGPASLDSVTPYTTTPLLDDGERCSDDGARASADDETWVLGLRFSEAPPW